MPGKPKITMYDKPRVMYLRRRELNPRVYKIEAVGQTSRSWLVGSREWDRTKYQFSEYEEVTREEYKLYEWANAHRYEISRQVSSTCLPPATLRQIADLIGYEEAPNAR